MLVSLCLRLKWHAGWTSNLLYFMLIMDPLLQGIRVLSRKMGQTPDSSVSAAKFSAIPRGCCTQGGETSQRCRGLQACKLTPGACCLHAFLYVLQTRGLPRDRTLQENSHCPQATQILQERMSPPAFAQPSPASETIITQGKIK